MENANCRDQTSTHNEIITFSPITDLPCNTLKFKLPNASKKAYTVEERAMLLSYLKTLEQDAYTLAIQFAFYGIFRVGEIKGLTWDTKNFQKPEFLF